MLARVGIGWPSAGKSTPLRGLTKIVGGLVVGFGGGEGPWLGFGFFNSGDDVADWRPSRYGSLLLAVPFLPPFGALALFAILGLLLFLFFFLVRCDFDTSPPRGGFCRVAHCERQSGWNAGLNKVKF